MNNETDLKELVREKYSQIAQKEASENRASCCGATNSCSDGMTIMADDYSSLEGYNPDADLGLGCGIPTQYAKMKEGKRYRLRTKGNKVVGFFLQEYPYITSVESLSDAP